MSVIAQKISGCYRRVLFFLLLIVLVGIGVGVFVYNQVGGAEGLKYWMAARSLKGTEKLLIGNRPDGIPKETVEKQFQDAYDALKIRQIDLKALYDLIKSYQERFHNPGLSPIDNKPSTPEIEEFLTNLNQTIFREE